MATNTSLTDITGQLPEVGSNVGDFLSNLTPGVVTFVFIVAIVSGVSAIILAIVLVIKSTISKKK